MKVVSVLLVFLLMLSFVAIHVDNMRQVDTTMQVEAIYLSTDECITAVVSNSTSYLSFKRICGKLMMFLDVPVGNRDWVRYIENSANGRMVLIHIHSLNEIKESGWDYGKFGSGTNHKLE